MSLERRHGIRLGPRRPGGRKSGDHCLGTGSHGKQLRRGLFQGTCPRQVQNGKKLGKAGQGPSRKPVPAVRLQEEEKSSQSDIRDERGKRI